jgi:hypothetical protein
MGTGATTLDLRRIANNCVIFNYVTAVALAMAMPSVSPVMSVNLRTFFL